MLVFFKLTNEKVFSITLTLEQLLAFLREHKEEIQEVRIKEFVNDISNLPCNCLCHRLPTNLT